MTLDNIIDYLTLKNAELTEDIIKEIEQLKEMAISNQDEIKANQLWCLETIYFVQSKYINAYKNMKKASVASDELNKEGYDSEKSLLYESAWNLMDQCDIQIGFLEENYCIDKVSIESFRIYDILEDIKRITPLFPYKLFTSRELIVKKQRCSICGRDISIRTPCPHKKGKLYMGEMCCHEITDGTFLNLNLVTNPFDKYAICKFQGNRFDFSLLDYIIPLINPYSKWFYTVNEVLLPEYRNIEKNDPCPCGSGINYIQCLSLNKDRHYRKKYSFKIAK